MLPTATFQRSDPQVVNGAQVRAARALLDWSVSTTAEHCSISAITVKRFESGQRTPGLDILAQIVSVFEENDVVFIDTPWGAGVLFLDSAKASIANEYAPRQPPTGSRAGTAHDEGRARSLRQR